MLFKKAVLIIHGFAGGTYDQEDLANYLELNKSFDVFQFTLPGHNRNLSKVKHEDWINKSKEKVEWLIENGYNKIYLIGHSMGGVIATYLATQYKQVNKLVLLAPAFNYLNVVNKNINITESLKVTPKVLEEYGKDEIVARFLKLNISVLKEFMELVKEYYEYPSKVTCNTLIFQGLNDNLVPKSSSEYVYNNINGIKKLVYLKGVTHEICQCEKRQKIYELIEEFLKYNIGGGIDTL